MKSLRFGGRKNPKWMVPHAGIEPALLSELDFESSASTSSANGARHLQQSRLHEAPAGGNLQIGGRVRSLMRAVHLQRRLT
jgi:hypothetical protein